jgi:YVTN family beta-propeller protein
VLALALAAPAFAQVVDTQTRTVGPQLNGSVVASSNQLMTPAGTTVQLGSPVRAKAIAVNPNSATHSAAVLLMSAAQPIIVFDTRTGAVLQRYVPIVQVNGSPANVTYGSITGITYSADGSKLYFSQDYSNDVAVANVDPLNGSLTPAASISVPAPTAPNLYTPGVANAAGIAVSGATGLVALNANNTLGFFDTTTNTFTSQTAVGNAPNRVVIAGRYAYVSNEGGRPAIAGDFTQLSDGTPIVASTANGSAITGTVSVVDTATGQVTSTIDVGLHPAGMTYANGKVYVANSFSDSISVIDAATKAVTSTISVAVPVKGGAFGAGPNDIAVVGNVAFVTLGQCNAIAVVSLVTGKVAGYIPTLYFPTTIAYDRANNQLVVSDDKGLGAQGSIGSAHGVDGFNTHQDTGTVSLIKLPTKAQLTAYTAQVIANNGWQNPYTVTGPVNPRATPVAVPVHAGEPSLIKHVWLVIKENRTYDQMLGDVAQGNGDPSLAVFASAVPNQHALVQRFPLLDNFYDPSRQSADGHPWAIESGSFYSNDILSPDWVRSYPGGNDNDALTYTPEGFIWSQAVAMGLSVKLYGEWSDGSVVATNPATGQPYSWADFYNTHLYTISGGTEGANIVPVNGDTEHSSNPSSGPLLDPNYPSFNLGIPDQYRMDYYIKQFNTQVANNAVPTFTVMWLPDDHTNGNQTTYPGPLNYQADNDLALGRLVQAISTSNVWDSSAIFVEEDDAQDGVDHVDGHRSTAYVISPYTAAPVKGNGAVIDTTYTQENIARTIENILGMQPLTQFDLVAAPMFDCFQNTPNDAPFYSVPATTPLNENYLGQVLPGTGPVNYTQNLIHRTPMMKSWELASAKAFQGKENKADSVDPDFLNHAIWYATTHFARPYPGETKILPPTAFHTAATAQD